MKIQQFLQHHGLHENPFSQEDAKEDKIFKQSCIDHMFHPAWDKIIGDVEAPSSAVVFGEKGSGKTALRFQMVDFIQKYNAQHPDKQVLVLEYDDFNPYLDQFCLKEPSLARWELRDHMDAVLSLGVSKLVNMILGHPPQITRQQLHHLDRLEKRDLLMLAAIYDRSHDTTLANRWFKLRRALRFGWPVGGVYAKREFLIGLAVSAALAAAVYYFQWGSQLLQYWWLFGAILLAGWLPALYQWARAHFLAERIAGSIRALAHLIPDLRRVLLWFRKSDIDGQPICELSSSDARYVLLNKLQAVLRRLGYRSIMVIVDRVDEPHRVSGNSAVMHQVMRSIFDLKFLQHPDMGIKLLLPGELYPHIQSENQEFRDRARLDKQKFIPSLVWTAQSLEDLVNDRLRASSANTPPPTIRDLFDESVSTGEVASYLEHLKIPRHVFKFFYQLLTNHSNAYTEAAPAWKISRETFLTTRAVFDENLHRYEQGLIMG